METTETNARTVGRHDNPALPPVVARLPPSRGIRLRRGRIRPGATLDTTDGLGYQHRAKAMANPGTLEIATQP